MYVYVWSLHACLWQHTWLNIYLTVRSHLSNWSDCLQRYPPPPIHYSWSLLKQESLSLIASQHLFLRMSFLISILNLFDVLMPSSFLAIWYCLSHHDYGFCERYLCHKHMQDFKMGFVFIIAAYYSVSTFTSRLRAKDSW